MAAPKKKKAVRRSEFAPGFLESKWFPLILTGVYLVLGVIGLSHHEMWRDEHQAWLVARDAGSLTGLYENMRYEGNPMLWHTLLWVLNFFTANPVAMQTLHIIIAASFIYVLARYSPFPRWMIILLAFNYFLFYEYAIISRGYGLGVLLAFIACALYPQRAKYFLPLSLVLFFLSNTSIYGTMMALAICGIMVLTVYFRPATGASMPLWKTGVVLISTLAGAALCFYQVKPEPDNSFPIIYPPESFEWSRLWFCSWKVFTTWFSFPNVQELHFWNTSILVGDSYIEFPWLPILLLAAISLVFARQKAILIIFVIGICGMVGFFYYSLLTHARYLGHMFILLLICLWLSEYLKKEQGLNPGKPAQLIRKYLVTAALLFSAAGGVAAWAKDMNVPFSGSVEAAEFLRKEKLGDMTIVGATDFVISCLPSLLQKEHAYYPERKEWGSFCIWDSKRAPKIDFNVVIQSIDSFLKLDNKPVLLILSAPPMKAGPGGQEPVKEDFIAADIKIRLLKAVTKVVVKDEEFYIYIAERVK